MASIFDTTITDITTTKIVPKLYDVNLNGNVTLARVIGGNSKSWTSGERLQFVIRHAKSTQGGVSGLGGKLNTSRDNTTAQLEYSPKRVTEPVVYDILEKRVNQGDEQVLELAGSLMTRAMADLFDNMGDYLFTGTGSGTALDSLANINDDGSAYTTVGGLTRSTYGDDLDSYLSSSVGALALADMRNLNTGTTVGAKTASLYVTTPAVLNYLENLYTPTVSANYSMARVSLRGGMFNVNAQSGLSADLGFTAMSYRGIPVVGDDKVTSGTMQAINEQYFNWYGIDGLEGLSGIKFSDKTYDSAQEIPATFGFGWTGFKMHYDQLGEVGHLAMHGNYASPNPRMLGKLTGITS